MSPTTSYSTSDPAGDTVFDPALNMVPRCAWAGFYIVCEGAVTVIVYTIVQVLYHSATLTGIGRILLRQSTWRWPPPSKPMDMDIDHRFLELELPLAPNFPSRVHRLLLAPRLGSAAWSACGRVRGVGGVA
jgi:hypothetical protein